MRGFLSYFVQKRFNYIDTAACAYVAHEWSTVGIAHDANVVISVVIGAAVVSALAEFLLIK